MSAIAIFLKDKSAFLSVLEVKHVPYKHWGGGDLKITLPNSIYFLIPFNLCYT